MDRMKTDPKGSYTLGKPLDSGSKGPGKPRSMSFTESKMHGKQYILEESSYKCPTPD